MSFNFAILKKTLLLACIILGLFFTPKTAHAAGEFITTWKTDNAGTSANNQITLPTTGDGYSFDVDWGDASSTLGVTTTITHSYLVAGTYTVTVSGTFPRIYFNNGGDKLKILSIEQWGTGQWDYMYAAFKGASNLVINAVDAPDLSNVTTLAEMFNAASSVNADLSGWDVSNVTSMAALFYAASSFNGDVSTWDVSHVTDISGIFGGATSFNQDISGWDVSSVITLNSSFTGATNFNQDIGAWDVSNVTNMDYTFYNATSFNQDLSAWNVSNVTSMISLFNGSAFNQPLNTWDVSSVTSMVNLFYGTPFNQPLDTWDVSSVTNMSGMFAEDTSFNQDVNTWDVSHVSNMAGMFLNTTAFNQSLDAWDVSNVADMSNFLVGVTLSTSNYDALLRSWSLLPLQNNVTFNGGLSQYCSSPQRSSIVSSFNWTITTDGGVESCHTVTYSGGRYGSISGFAIQGVENASTTVAVTVVPRSGYRFVSWSDGSTENPRTDSNVISDITVTAQFKRISLGGGGSRKIIKKNVLVTSTPTLPMLSSPIREIRPSVSLSTTSPRISLPCSDQLYPTEFIAKALPNSDAQVKLLQKHLNTYEQANLVLDGSYDSDDEAAVIAWQEKYASEILAPWGLSHGTGFIYKTSLQKFKSVFLAQCTGELPPLVSTNAKVFTRDLKFAMVGEDVRALQKILGVKETGYFGPLTESALVAYQISHNIVPASGYFGPLTRALLNSQ